MSVYQEFLKKQHKIRPVYDFREIVYKSALDFSDLPAFVMRDRTITYSQLKTEYQSLCTYLIKNGYENKRIAVVGANSYNWILSYLACATVGVVVPIDKELAVPDMMNFIKEGECVAVFGDDSIISQMTDFDGDRFVIAEKKNKTPSGKLINDLLKEGEEAYKKGLNTIDTMEINREEMSILIFTSGTTGNSKGVMLSQKNICANINSTAKMVKVDSTLHSLSVLPLHHTYETTLGHLLLLSGGSCISYADGLRQVAKNITEYSPSVLIVVPLLLEFILKRINTQIRSSLPKFLLLSEDTSLLDMLKGFPPLIRYVVKKKVKKSLGGKLRLLIVGAAPIKPEVIETYCFLGITTYQGYGLTETSPLLAGNNDFYMNPASTGLPIPDVEIKIENPNKEGVGEIIAKGDNVMIGYYNDEEETQRVMRGGYFHTGDLGKLDEDGFLYITGRCKNVIVAQNGKNIYPEELENRLLEYPAVAEAVVLGVANAKGGASVKAKIFPCFDEIVSDYKETDQQKQEIVKAINKTVSDLNETLPIYKQIAVTEVVWEAFEKTTTKKIKRFGNNVI